MLAEKQLAFFNQHAFTGHDVFEELLVGSVDPHGKVAIYNPGELCWPFIHSPELYWDWINHPQRRHYGRVCFAPEHPYPEHPDVLNLWAARDTPSNEGSCRLFLMALRNDICGGDPDRYNMLLSWIKGALQTKPDEERPPVLVIRRAENGLLERELRKLFDGRSTAFPLDRWTGHRELVWIDGIERHITHLTSLISAGWVDTRFYSGHRLQHFIGLTDAPWKQMDFPAIEDEPGDALLADEMDNHGRDAFIRHLFEREETPRSSDL
jgi:hypothetical protein